MMHFRGIIMCVMVVCVLLIINGCAMGPVVKNRTPLTDTQMQVPPISQIDYRITVGDELDIKFHYNPELNERLPVRPDGRIALQLVSEITVVGLTPLELRDLLIKKYASEINKPEVTVIVRSFIGSRIFVDGEVNRVGPVPLLGPMTILQSITFAGGLRESARTNEVILIRQGKDNKPIATTVNLEKVLDGTDFSQDIYLKPYDIVFIPRSPIANVDLWVDQYIRRLLPFALPSPIPAPTTSTTIY